MNKRRLAPLFFAAALAGTAPAAFCADDLDQIQALTQQEFRLFSRDLAAALSWHPLRPTTPLGVTGFDIAIGATGTKLENQGAFETAAGGDFPSTMPVPSLRLHKGLPWNIDVGVMIATVPGSNVQHWGAELSYAFISGVAVPSIGVRGAYTRLTGVEQLDFDTRSLDISIAKGFAGITPYAGIGKVWADSNPKVSGLNKEEVSETKAFLGLQVNLGITNLVFEVDKTGDTATYGAKLGLRF
jgi:hypothetical protein